MEYLAIFAIGMLSGYFIERPTINKLRKLLIEYQNKFSAMERRKSIAIQESIKDPDNQIKYINSVPLAAKKPINSEAYAVFKTLETAINEKFPGHRIFAETAMGSFIKTDNKTFNTDQSKKAFSSYNSKRVDFLIIDHFGHPALVIEYHGSGHYQNNADQRDKVKKLALQKASIPLLEVEYGTSHGVIEAETCQILKHNKIH